MNGARSNALFGVALALVAFPAHAQMPTNIPRGIGFEVGVHGQPAFPAKTDDGGELARSRVALDVNYRLPAWGRLQNSLGLEFEQSQYDFGDIDAFRELPDNAHYTRATLTTRGLSPGGWWWMLTPSLREGTFAHSDTQDGLTGYLLALASPMPTNRFAWSFGLIARTHLEESPDVFPILGFQWRISDAWLLRTTDELSLLYTPDTESKWQFEWRAAYRRREYRLPTSSASWSEGVFADQQTLSALVARWRPIPPLSISLYAGHAFAQEIELQDHNGHTVERLHADPAPVAGLDVRMRF